MIKHRNDSQTLEAKKDKAQQENEIIIDSYDYLANAASSQDCTGLIPSAIVDENEIESYESLYKFIPKKISKERNANTD